MRTEIAGRSGLVFALAVGASLGAGFGLPAVAAPTDITVAGAVVAAPAVGTITVLKHSDTYPGSSVLPGIASGVSRGIPGAEFTVSRVVDASGTPISYSSTTKLPTVATAKTQPGTEYVAVTDTSGVARFPGLPAGVYLVRETRTPNGIQPALPFIAPLPYLDTHTGSLVYEYTAFPKNEPKPSPTPTAPSTPTPTPSEPSTPTPTLSESPTDTPTPTITPTAPITPTEQPTGPATPSPTAEPGDVFPTGTPVASASPAAPSASPAASPTISASPKASPKVTQGAKSPSPTVSEEQVPLDITDGGPEDGGKSPDGGPDEGMKKPKPLYRTGVNATLLGLAAAFITYGTALVARRRKSATGVPADNPASQRNYRDV